MSNKYLALKGEDKFDINKVTVVGSPTITSDGVASGFSVNDYLTANVNINSSDFDIDFEFTLPNVSSGGQYAFRFNNSSNTRFVVNNAKIFMYDNTNLELCPYTYTNNYNAGDLIKAKLKATSSGITLNLLNKTKNTTVTVSSSKVQNIEASLITFGRSATTVATDIFTGSINLPSFKVTTNGTTFSPTKPTYLLERRKEGYDPSKFTVVGSPTITSDGVASGFSGSNYVKKEITLTDNWGFVLPIKITDESVTTQWIVAFLSEANERICIIRKEGNYLYIQGFNGAVSSYAFAIPYVLNQTVYLKAVKNGTSLVLSYSNDLKNWIDRSFDLTGYEIANVSKVFLGIVDTSWQAFLGSIDLKQFSITADGKEVFTGAKEQFYMLRR